MSHQVRKSNFTEPSIAWIHLKAETVNPMAEEFSGISQ